MPGGATQVPVASHTDPAAPIVPPRAVQSAALVEPQNVGPKLSQQTTLVLVGPVVDVVEPGAGVVVVVMVVVVVKMLGMVVEEKWSGQTLGDGAFLRLTPDPSFCVSLPPKRLQ